MLEGELDSTVGGGGRCNALAIDALGYVEEEEEDEEEGYVETKEEEGEEGDGAEEKDDAKEEVCEGVLAVLLFAWMLAAADDAWPLESITTAEGSISDMPCACVVFRNI